MSKLKTSSKIKSKRSKKLTRDPSSKSKSNSGGSVFKSLFKSKTNKDIEDHSEVKEVPELPKAKHKDKTAPITNSNVTKKSKKLKANKDTGKKKLKANKDTGKKKLKTNKDTGKKKLKTSKNTKKTNKLEPSKSKSIKSKLIGKNDKNKLKKVEKLDTDFTAEEMDLHDIINNEDSLDAIIHRYGKTKLKFEMYFQYLLYAITKGGKVRRNSKLGKDSFQIELDRIYTYNNVIKIWAIEMLPEMVDVDYEFEFKQQFSNMIPNSTLLIKEVSLPYYIDFESDDLSYHLSYWAKVAKSTAQDDSEISNDALRFLTESSKRFNVKTYNKRMIRSFYKVKEYQRRQHFFTKTYKFLYVYTPDDSTMRDAESLIKNYFSNGFNVYPIKKYIPEFIKTFGCAYLQENVLPMRKVTPLILSDLDVAELEPHEQGVIGDMGTCVGVDVDNNAPVWLSFTSDAKGQTILITAKTGEGKSFFIKGIALFHKMQGHRMVFMDYEGQEYTPFINNYGGLRISQGLDNAVCVNTLKIGNCNELSDKDADIRFQKCMNATNRIFKILYADTDEEIESSDLDALIDDVLSFAYKKVNVYEGIKSTYANSDKLTYFDIYDTLEIMNQGTMSVNKHGKLIDSCLKRLHSYWSREGSKKYDEIFAADSLQISLGMSEQNENTVPHKEILLKYFNMDYIITEYNTYNRKHNLFTAVFIEELQRAAGSKRLLSLYNHLVTGGRKLNLINYLITNSVSVLLNNKDSLDAVAIKSNISTLLVGMLEEDDRNDIVKAFSMQKVSDLLEEVSTSPTMDNCFLLQYTKKRVKDAAVVRMDLPDEIAHSPVFDTRTVVKEG